MNICLVAGARPNFIKLAPLIRAIRNAEGVDYQLVYTGTADDHTLEGTLFDDLQIPQPDVCLGVACESINELTGSVMAAFEHHLEQHPTDVVVVVDDLASTMAAAIVTKKQGISLVHLVAGTRSFDIRMPKEINRLVIDGLSDYLFTAGISNNSIVNREGAATSKVYMVGNILLDNLRYNRSRWKRPQIMDQLSLQGKDYLLFTLNRKALIQNHENLKAMVEEMMRKAGRVKVLAPLREQALAAVAKVIRDMPADIPHPMLITPLNYLEFGYLQAHALGVITDSGNVSEEATFNSVPCITLNSYTEHIETVKVGTNELVGEDAGLLGEMVGRIINGQWKHGSLPERWDGRTAERILNILVSNTDADIQHHPA